MFEYFYPCLSKNTRTNLRLNDIICLKYFDVLVTFLDLKMVVKLERPVEKDLNLVMELVNAAYKVEKGSTGLAFKASDR